MGTGNSEEKKPFDNLSNTGTLFLDQAGVVNYSFGVDDQSYSYTTVNPANTVPANSALANTKLGNPTLETTSTTSKIAGSIDASIESADHASVVSRPANLADDLAVSNIEIASSSANAPAKYHKFSEYFDFDACLKSVFRKIDVNHDNRLSKNELYAAIRSRKFNDDEEVLAGLVLEQFDRIRRQKMSSSTFFDERGVNLQEIVTFPWGNLLPPNCR